jgi:hypothetical protein
VSRSGSSSWVLGLLFSCSLGCGDSAPADLSANEGEATAVPPGAQEEDAGGGFAVADAGPPDAEVNHACPSGQIWCGICIDAIEPTGDAIQKRVFAGSCALSKSCHGGLAPQEKLGLDSLDDVFEHAVGKRSKQRPELSLIEPGKPEQSYLVHKLRNLDLAATATDGDEATQMPPPPGAPLCESKIQAVEAWITAGAPR